MQIYIARIQWYSHNPRGNCLWLLLLQFSKSAETRACPHFRQTCDSGVHTKLLAI